MVDLNILLLATTVAAAIIPRDAAQILNDLRTLNSDAQSIITATKNWNGRPVEAVFVENAVTKLDKDVQYMYKDAQASNTLSETEAQSNIEFIRSTLEPSILSAIRTIEDRSIDVSEDGLNPTFKSDFQKLQNHVDALGQTLISKAPADKQDATKSVFGKIHSDFQDGINYFS